MMGGKKHEFQHMCFVVHTIISRQHVSPIASIWKEARWSKTYPPVIDLERQEEEKTHRGSLGLFWRSREMCGEERVAGHVARFYIRSMQKETSM
jgi:activator of HSP90 ATPase